MGSRSGGALRAAGPPALLAGIAAVMWLGYRRECRRRA